MLRALYLLASVGLSFYGVHALIMLVLYWRNHPSPTEACRVPEADYPLVAVQLPVYNERYVVERLIDAAAALDYPGDRLEIQVLDDSTDDTTQIAEARARHYREQGLHVQVIHRTQRDGYKAGALQAGLEHTTASYVAIFDADFRPLPDFLQQTVAPFLTQPDLAAVQVRWAHLNDIYSPLTRAQAILLDGHFGVEQAVRNWSGLLTCFNGSGGVWRRAAIEAAGGWQSDTMTEDLDLSYRAQLAGWRILYRPDVVAPAELPAQMQAFKQQQARWAQGSVQCLRKLGGPIVRSRLSLGQKVMALWHLGAYLMHPLAVALLVLSLPLLIARQSLPGTLTLLALLSLFPPLLFALSQTSLHDDWLRRFLYFPVVVLVGTGVAWSTTRAISRGLLRWGGTFVRTPKFRIEGRQGTWAGTLYRLLPDRALVGELALTAYAALGIAVAWLHGSYGALPFLLLCGAGFGSVAAVGVFQAAHR